VAKGRKVGWPAQHRTVSWYGVDPKIVVVNVIKNTHIFMTFGMQVEKSASRYVQIK
jgi:hypothetical protein